MVQLSVDIALAWLVVESIVLLVLMQKGRLTMPLRAFATLGAGFCLLLALRMSVVDATTLLILPVLGLAGGCHIVEVSLLLGRTGAPSAAS